MVRDDPLHTLLHALPACRFLNPATQATLLLLSAAARFRAIKGHAQSRFWPPKCYTFAWSQGHTITDQGAAVAVADVCLIFAPAPYHRGSTGLCAKTLSAQKYSTGKLGLPVCLVGSCFRSSLKAVCYADGLCNQRIRVLSSVPCVCVDHCTK